MQTKQHKIAATFITHKLDKVFITAVKSVAPYVDGIFVNYNGPEDVNYLDVSKLHKNIAIKYFKWEDDFALARNQVFSMVPKEEYDWLFWMDRDDVLANGDKFQDLINSLDSETQGVMLKYEYGVEPETGEVLVEQWRERLLRTDGSWRWDYPIHEVCHAPPGTQYTQRQQVWIIHKREEGADDSETRARNRRILVKARRENPNEGRHHFYFANEVFAEAVQKDGSEAEGLFYAAIESYKKFIDSHQGSLDDEYVSAHRIAECFRILGDQDKAINWELQCLKILPDWPEAYLGIAQSSLEMGDPGKAKAWADLCIKLGERPHTPQAVEPLNQKYYPFLIRGLAREDLGEWEGALEDFKEAYLNRKSNSVADKIQKIEGILKDKPETIGDLRKSLRNTNTDKSIAFVTRPTPEPWHPEIEKQGGIGGSETCVMEIAKRFAADDWRVAVFGSPGTHAGVYEGIEWWDGSLFNPTEKFEVLVSSRTPELFDAELRSKHKFLWMHDVNVGDQMQGHWGSRIDNLDKVIGLTNWHSNYMKSLYKMKEESLCVIPNGIDLDRFKKYKPRQAYKFVWSNSPDRGLDVVVGLWPTIKSLIPEAELHIYYGWNSIDAVINSMPNSEAAEQLGHYKRFLEQSIYSINQNGESIFMHGRVPQKKLAKEFTSCMAWLYPTYFMETFCITALEMQMAGVLPITTNLAGLKETVAVPELKINGYPRNMSYQNRFLALLQDVLEQDQDVKEEWREIGKAHASQFTWDNAYGKWNDQISLLKGKELVFA